MRELDEYDDRNWELNRRVDRDGEREPRASVVAPVRRRQFRYWSGSMFRRVQLSRVRSVQHTHPGEPSCSISSRTLISI
jgi:hypothetical protein